MNQSSPLCTRVNKALCHLMSNSIGIRYRHVANSGIGACLVIKDTHIPH